MESKLKLYIELDDVAQSQKLVKNLEYLGYSSDLYDEVDPFWFIVDDYFYSLPYVDYLKVDIPDDFIYCNFYVDTPFCAIKLVFRLLVTERDQDNDISVDGIDVGNYYLVIEEFIELNTPRLKDLDTKINKGTIISGVTVWKNYEIIKNRVKLLTPYQLLDAVLKNKIKFKEKLTNSTLEFD